MPPVGGSPLGSPIVIVIAFGGTGNRPSWISGTHKLDGKGKSRDGGLPPCPSPIPRTRAQPQNPRRTTSAESVIKSYDMITVSYIGRWCAVSHSE
jgi:hypothetical protein